MLTPLTANIPSSGQQNPTPTICSAGKGLLPLKHLMVCQNLLQANQKSPSTISSKFSHTTVFAIAATEAEKDKYKEIDMSCE